MKNDALNTLEKELYTIELLRAETFRQDNAIIQSLRNLLAPSYEDPSMVLQRELAHCTHLYLAKNKDELLCFFLVAWEYIDLPNGERIPAIYMGLSAARQDIKSSGIVRYVYSRAMSDALKWEKQLGKRLIGWATMATPSSYHFCSSMVTDVQPSPDGSYSEDGAKIASAIKKQYGYDSSSEHPFVLKSAAHSTRYSESETQRIERISKEKHFDLFTRLDIQEKRGDRLLIIGYSPDIPKNTA